MGERRAPEKATRDNQGARILLDALLGGDPHEGIRREEAHGQSQLVHSNTLPTKMPPEARAALETAGVKFGEVVSGDSLFQFVELPRGWHKVPQSSSYWTNLVDESGQVRAMIFYKAALYDRRADLSLAS